MSAHAFPLEALPEWMGSYVASVAQSLQVPMEMPGAFALGALATAAARTACVQPHNDHVEPLNLFVALVAPPGQKKSACIGAFFKEVDSFERELQEEGAGERRTASLARERLAQSLEEAKSGEQWDRALALSEELANVPCASVPQLTTADVTAQKLASLLAEHQCMAVVSAEPSVIPTMLGRWSNGKTSTELEVFLQGHAGDPIKVDRQGRPSERVEQPRLTLVVALQPEALRSLSRSETAGRGLLARFLWVLPPDIRGQPRLRNSRPIPFEHRLQFKAGLRRMLRAAPLDAPVTFTDEATDLWIQFHDGFEKDRLGPGGDMRDLHGWGEKHRGHVARIAGCLHLAEGCGAAPLERDTLHRAIVIGQWLESHALAAFDMMNLRADVREANEILEVIVRLERSTITRRELHQALKDRARFKRARDLERGLAALIDRKLLTTRRIESPRPGRPSVVFDVHELVFSEGFEGVSGGLR